MVAMQENMLAGFDASDEYFEGLRESQQKQMEQARQMMQGLGGLAAAMSYEPGGLRFVAEREVRKRACELATSVPNARCGSVRVGRVDHLGCQLAERSPSRDVLLDLGEQPNGVDPVVRSQRPGARPVGAGS